MINIINYLPVIILIRGASFTVHCGLINKNARVHFISSFTSVCTKYNISFTRINSMIHALHYILNINSPRLSTYN